MEKCGGKDGVGRNGEVWRKGWSRERGMEE